MNNKKTLFGIVIVLISVISFAVYYFVNPSVVHSQNGYYVSEYARISELEWERHNISNMRFENPEELLLEIDEYVQELEKLIDREGWDTELRQNNGRDFNTKIEVEFTYDYHSRAIGAGTQRANYSNNISPKIKLSRRSIEYGYEEIAHELTHIISPKYQSVSLNEGLACYVNDVIGRETVRFLDDQEIHRRALKFIDNDEVMKFIGNDSTDVYDIYTSYTSVRNEFYVLSYSFVSYLIEKYGMESFLKVYSSKDTVETYNEVYNRQYVELINDWKKHLKTFEE